MVMVLDLATDTSKTPSSLPPQHVLVAVPRGVLAKYREATFADLLAAAERGDDGLFVTNSRDYGISYFRAGDKGGAIAAVDAPLLYCQGWVKAS